MHLPSILFLCALSACISSPPDSIDYLRGDIIWDTEIGGPVEDGKTLQLKNPLSVPTDDDQSDSRKSSLETVVWGSTPTVRNPIVVSPVGSSPRSPKAEWRTFTSVSSDTGNASRIPHCPTKAMLASIVLMLTAAGLLGILYFGFPSTFDKLF